MTFTLSESDHYMRVYAHVKGVLRDPAHTAQGSHAARCLISNQLTPFTVTGTPNMPSRHQETIGLRYSPGSSIAMGGALVAGLVAASLAIVALAQAPMESGRQRVFRGASTSNMATCAYAQPRFAVP